MTKNVEQEIILCTSCDGEGTVEHSELHDYHRGEYRYWNVLCKKCNGSGRLRKTITIETEVEPYTNDKVAELMYEKLKGDGQQAK